MTEKINPAVDRDGLTIVNDLRLDNYSRAGQPIPPDVAQAPVFLTGGLDLSGVTPEIEAQRLPHVPMLVHLMLRGAELFEALLVLHPLGDDGGYRSRVLSRSTASPNTVMWPSEVDVTADGVVRIRNRDPAQAWAADELQKMHDFHTERITDVAAVLTLVNTPRLITYEAAQVGPHLLRRWERKPQQRIDYRVIRLPDGRLTHGRSIPVDGVPAGVALHSVRGHFVTYTADAPLFGRLVGTYWHRPSIRGTDRHGEVVKDYEVQADEQQ